MEMQTLKEYFSIGKYTLNIHGSSTSQKTIETFRLVKDYVILYGVVNDMNLSKAMIKECLEARQRQEEDLKANKMIEKQTATEEKKREEAKKGQR